MRRLIATLTVLVLLAAACGGSDASSDTAVAGSGDVSNSSDDAAEGSAPQTESDDSAAAASGATTASDGVPVDCGRGSGAQPVAVQVEQIPGSDRTSDPSAIFNPINLDLPEPLVDTSRIISGGPPPDGIPPIDTPRFQTAGSVDWLECNEPVLSLVVDGEARAYPIQIMTWHEIVNDTFGDRAVSVSFCPLCNSALVYDRDLGGDVGVVTFGTSGRLFNSSLVMYDRTTESLWTHFNGQAVAGALTGTQLDLLPVQTTSWENFLRQHPDGIVLTRQTGHDRPYGDNPYTGYDDVTTNPFLLDIDPDGRLAAKERVVAIEIADDSVAVVLEHLATQAVVVEEIGGRTVSVWHLPGLSSALDTTAIPDGRDVGTVGVYIPEADGQNLTFSRNDDGTFTDAETGSTWDIGGIATDGPLAGTALEAIERIDTFWFAIAAFQPETRIVNT